MDSPEYLDLDAIDFSEEGISDAASVCDSSSGRPCGELGSPSNSSVLGGSLHKLNPAVPGMFLESKYRPVKRVPPLTHQPPETGPALPLKPQHPVSAGHSSSSLLKPQHPAVTGNVSSPLKKHASQQPGAVQPKVLAQIGHDAQLGMSMGKQGGSSLFADAKVDQSKATDIGVKMGLIGSPERQSKARASPYSFQFLWKSLGELEHYDLELDEILDVPYANYQSATMDTGEERKPEPQCKLDRAQSSGLCLSATEAQWDPVNGKAVTSQSHTAPQTKADVHTSSDENGKGKDRQGCTQPHEIDVHEQDLLEATTTGLTVGSSSGGAFKCPEAEVISQTLPRVLNSISECAEGEEERGAACQSVTKEHAARGAMGIEVLMPQPEEMTKARSIITAIAEGHVSLLRKQLSESAERIRDEGANNVLHMAATSGQLECLQYLASALPEDGLLERNAEGLTPTATAIKNGHLESVMWLVSETEAGAELSVSVERPALIHFAARFGQERILVWLLQYMQEEGVSLDGLDPDGNSAAHVAAREGHLACLQTLVEYGASVTTLNKVGQKPLQCAEKHRHPTCARYLVVVETCMSLASQVVKLTKQLREKTSEIVKLQSQLQVLTGGQASASIPDKVHPARWSGSSPDYSRSSGSSPESTQLSSVGRSASQELVNAKPIGGQTGGHGSHLPPKAGQGLFQGAEDTDTVLRNLLGEEISGQMLKDEKLSLEFPDKDKKRFIQRQLHNRKAAGPGAGRPGYVGGSPSDGRPSSSSSTDSSSPVNQQRPRPRPIVEKGENLHFVLKKHAFDGGRAQSSSSPDSAGQGSDPGAWSAPKMSRSVSLDSGTAQTEGGSSSSASTPELRSPKSERRCSPKSALKSPTSRGKSLSGTKLRVTFEEPLVHVAPPPEPTQPSTEPSADGGAGPRGGGSPSQPANNIYSVSACRMLDQSKCSGAQSCESSHEVEEVIRIKAGTDKGPAEAQEFFL
ncbi:synphilin-1 isoform X1 [Lampetra fluviatilis]